MKRRTFITFTALTPAFLVNACKEKAFDTPVAGEPGNAFQILEAKGSYEEIGFQIGNTFKGNIERVIDKRKKWFDKLQTIAGSDEGKLFSKKLLEVTNEHFPQYINELRGMAEGSGLSFDEMWNISINSELNVFEKEPLGCSTIYYQDDQNAWLTHNEDGDMAYSGEMFIVKASPPSGIEFYTLVYPGTIMGVGPSFNSAGIIETTNFIGTTKANIGIPRFFIGRAILEASSIFAALQIASKTPRAFPWHHNIASMKDGKYLSVETLPDGRLGINSPKHFPYVHTNHLINENTNDYDNENVEYKDLSSVSRMRALRREGVLEGRTFKRADDLVNKLSSHEGKPYSPCRHAEGDVTGQTLATAQFDLKKKKARYYAGNPCQSLKNNNYNDFSF